jgi:enterochelin esterase-like enzyme
MSPIQAASTGERSHGTVHEDAFYSTALGVDKHLVVYLPPSYGRDPTRRYPVAYYLRLGITHHYAEWPGTHTWRYWSTHAAESLAWTVRQIN